MEKASDFDSYISAGVPLARRDHHAECDSYAPKHFYSRASCEARLKFGLFADEEINFYSRASCEARLLQEYSARRHSLFLLTRLSRGATSQSAGDRLTEEISTHAPLARRDYSSSTAANPAGNFYSRASREARLQLFLRLAASCLISTHAPLARRDVSIPYQNR